jgi:hypothetical protein
VAALSGPALEGYLIVALFGYFLLRRTYAMTQGVRASAGRLLFLPALYVGLYAAALAGTWYAGTGSGRSELTYLGLVADLALLGIGTWVAHRITSADVQLYRPAATGAWHYRLKPLLPLLYVVFFVARIATEAAVTGLAPFSIPSAAQFDALSNWAVYALFAVDALWGLTTGFLVGRSAAVYGAWQRAEKADDRPKPLPD